MRATYETLIEDLVLGYSGEYVAHGLAILDVDLQEHCKTVAKTYGQAENEVYELLMTCSYVAHQVAEQAWAESQKAREDLDLLDTQSVLCLGLWQDGVLTNISTQIMGEAYRALVSWWKRLCRALKRISRDQLAEVCAKTITLSLDLSLGAHATI